MKYIFGVDVGGTTVKLGLFSDIGSLMEKWSIPTVVTEKETDILQDIWNAVYGKMMEKGIARSQVLGIGIGVPGPVLDDGMVNRCVNLNWGRFNLVETMQNISGFHVQVGNDANVAALGEQWQGGGEGYDSIVMVTFGTGVGSGLILNGKILSGAHGSCGEVGHMHMVDGEPDRCGCGKYGCLEQFTSANGVVRLAKRCMNRHPELQTKLGKKGELNSVQIFQAAKEGDPLAVFVAREMFDMVGRAFAAISCVVDPQAFVIGGGLSNVGDYLIDGITEAYRTYAFHAAAGTVFRLAKLGNDAGIFGAARMVLNR